MKELNYTLTIEESNMALSALSKLPFFEVNNLIGKIQSQAKAQLEQPKEEEK